MKDKPWFAVVYMFVVTAVFSSVVIGVSRFTQDRVTANQQLAFERAVLEAFGLSEGKSPLTVHETFVNRVNFPDGQDAAGTVADGSGNTIGYVLPFAGKGFWAPIKGVLGLSMDKRTVAGIAFYEQNETPGLGGRIMEEDFRKQFVGKKLGDGEMLIEFRQAGSEVNDSQVHSITGATQTCTRLEKLMNEDIGQWLATRGGSNELQ